jgi:hypothetical protein
LIRLLALSGRRSETLAQYHRCRRLLAEELAVAPSPETTDLFEQIRDGNLAGTALAPQRRPGPTHNLPLASDPSVGRETEIAEIQNCLQDPACRLLTLVGAGGMGKTRLVLEAVTERQRSLRPVFDRSWMLLSEQEREVFQALSVFAEGFTVQFYWHSGRYREAEAAFSATAAAAGATADAATQRARDKVTCLRVWVQALAWQSSQDPALSGQDTRIERAILAWCMGATVCMADYAQGR